MELKNKQLDNINKIGIIMFGLLGDVLVRTPVIRALRELYPSAEIIAILDYSMRDILKNNEYVQKVILFDRNNKNQIKKNISKIKGTLSIRNEKFDLLVDLYNGGSTPFIVTLKL